MKATIVNIKDLDMRCWLAQKYTNNCKECIKIWKCEAADVKGKQEFLQKRKDNLLKSIPEIKDSILKTVADIDKQIAEIEEV